MLINVYLISDTELYHNSYMFKRCPLLILLNEIELISPQLLIRLQGEVNIQEKITTEQTTLFLISYVVR